jgi:hypothetical protein
MSRGIVMFPARSDWTETNAAGFLVPPPVRALVPLALNGASPDEAGQTIRVGEFSQFAAGGFDHWSVGAHDFDPSSDGFGSLIELYGPDVVGHFVMLGGAGDSDRGLPSYYSASVAIEHGAFTSGFAIDYATLRSMRLPPRVQWPTPIS